MSKIIHLNKKAVETQNAMLKSANTIQPKNKERRKTNTVIGSGIESCMIKAVESRRKAFVSRLHPDTTVEQIKNHLKMHNVEVLGVDKLSI